MRAAATVGGRQGRAPASDADSPALAARRQHSHRSQQLPGTRGSPAATCLQRQQVKAFVAALVVRATRQAARRCCRRRLAGLPRDGVQRNVRLMSQRLLVVAAQVVRGGVPAAPAVHRQRRRQHVQPPRRPAGRGNRAVGGWRLASGGGDSAVTPQPDYPAARAAAAKQACLPACSTTRLSPGRTRRSGGGLSQQVSLSLGCRARPLARPASLNSPTTSASAGGSGWGMGRLAVAGAAAQQLQAGAAHCMQLPPPTAAAARPQQRSSAHQGSARRARQRAAPPPRPRSRWRSARR